MLTSDMATTSALLLHVVQLVAQLVAQLLAVQPLVPGHLLIGSAEGFLLRTSTSSAWSRKPPSSTAASPHFEISTSLSVSVQSATARSSNASHAISAVHATCGDITVAIPAPDAEAAIPDQEWTVDAATNLSRYGVCVLTRTRPPATPNTQTGTSLIAPSTLCDAVNQAIANHLTVLHTKIRNRGIDPRGLEDGPYRFREVICRDGSPRFDVPVPWSGRAGSTCMSSEANAANGENEADGGRDMQTQTQHMLSDFVEDAAARRAVQEFHREVDDIVRPVMDALCANDGTNSNADVPTGGDRIARTCRASSAGFLVNQPGSTSQAWHRDGPEEGYINAFVPLVDLSESLGPTAILSGTHTRPDIRLLGDKDGDGSGAASGDGDGDGDCGDGVPSPIVPLLQKGQILLFDYRTLHRGLGNTNVEGGLARTLAYVVYTRGSITDVHNFPDALTLEYD